VTNARIALGEGPAFVAGGDAFVRLAGGAVLTGGAGGGGFGPGDAAEHVVAVGGAGAAGGVGVGEGVF